MLHKFASLALCLVAAACISPTITKGRGMTLKDSTFGQTRNLADVLKHNYAAIDFESPDARALLLKQAAQYVEYRRRSLSLSARATLLQKCTMDRNANPFCGVIAQRQLLESTRRKKPRLARAGQSSRILKFLDKADFAALEKLSERELIGALKSVSDFERLEQYALPVIANGSCSLSPVMAALGMKAENFFPDEKPRQIATTLYQRAIECDAQASTVRASYRLGLIQVWDNQCAKAENSLARFIDHPDATDYKSRMLYWRLRCAERSKNSVLTRKMRERLEQEYPLTFHGLLASNNPTDQRLSALSRREPDVLFRSQLVPALNRVFTAVEGLQEIKEYDVAFDALEPFLDTLSAAEPELRLYAAVLLMRSGDTIRKFQIMTSLFKESPDLVSKGSLEMLYPLRRFDLVSKFQESVDPLLVLSLIRQESAFNVKAHSRAGAMGLMQLMPRTARMMGRVSSRKALYDPELNIKYGVKFFSRLLDRYSNDAELALAAYNAGPERVDEWVKRYPVEDRLLFLDLVPYRETREYVASISRNYFWYLQLYATHLKTTQVLAGSQGANGVRLPSSESLRDLSKDLERNL